MYKIVSEVLKVLLGINDQPSQELLRSVSGPLSFPNGLKIAVKNRADMFEALGPAAFESFWL